MKRYMIVYISILVLVVFGIFWVDSNKSKPVDWSPSYEAGDKIPFGLYVMDHEMPSLFPGIGIHKFNETAYEYFHSSEGRRKIMFDLRDKGATYFYIGNPGMIDQESAKEIFRFTSKGNSAFISMADLPFSLADSLDIETNAHFDIKMEAGTNWAGSKDGKHPTATYKVGSSDNYFRKYPKGTQLLGFIKTDSVRPNYISVPFHSGRLYLHLQPVAFTNYALLQPGNEKYAEGVLSQLPQRDIYWNLQDTDAARRKKSSFSFIFSQPALAWAWRILLFGLLTFILFNIKRKQRVVPIVRPLTNTTVDFVKTIGNLYLQEKDHQNVMEKKIVYFLDRIRQEFMIETSTLDDTFAKRLQHKSGKDLADVEDIIRIINKSRNQNTSVTEQDLIALNSAIEKFFS